MTMRYLTVLAPALLLQPAACAQAPKPVSYVANTGSADVDAFIASVQRSDANDLEPRIYRFETISGLYPQYKTAQAYLDWIARCRISRVVQNGSDAAGDPVVIDRSLKSGPRAAQSGHFFWVFWTCPQGELRQALSVEDHAPKLLVSEILPLAREVPTVRPPE